MEYTEEIRADLLATSLAGHDKGRVSVVIGETGDRYLLADGTHSTLEHPKSKKKIHVRTIRRIPEPIRKRMDKIVNDREIKEIINMYENRNLKEGSLNVKV